MKNILKKATILALVLGTLSANATVAKINNSDDATVVQFGFVRKGAHIYIKDAQDYLLYKYKVDQAGRFFKRFDFTTLPDGNYKFEVHEDCTIQIKPFSIDKGSVTFEKIKDYTFFKPIITLDNDNKVTLSYLTLINDPLEVQIFDVNDRLLYKEEITSNSFKRIYNMSQITDKTVVLTLKTGGRRFIERIELE